MTHIKLLYQLISGNHINMYNSDYMNEKEIKNTQKYFKLCFCPYLSCNGMIDNSNRDT